MYFQGNQDFVQHIKIFSPGTFIISTTFNTYFMYTEPLYLISLPEHKFLVMIY